jgi:glutaconyl-CoA/methylmalonyl-CoA decarboxylase subunit delta
LILGFIALVVTSLKFLSRPDKVIAPITKEKAKQAFDISQIKDEDMMVAALVASIDYYEEIKKDVRVISVKEITNA